MSCQVGCGRHAYLGPSNIVLVLGVPIIALCGVCLVEDPRTHTLKIDGMRVHKIGNCLRFNNQQKKVGARGCLQMILYTFLC